MVNFQKDISGLLFIILLCQTLVSALFISFREICDPGIGLIDRPREPQK